MKNTKNLFKIMLIVVTLFSLTSSCSKDDSKTSSNASGTATLKVNTNIVLPSNNTAYAILVNYYEVQLINNGQIKTSVWSKKEQDVLTIPNVAYGDYTVKIKVSKDIKLKISPYTTSRQETSNTVNFKVNDPNVTVDIDG
jgi:hypothetical protein